jgi:hypothetical protein
MLNRLRTLSDEMILAEALIYFVFIGVLALAATLVSRIFN